MVIFGRNTVMEALESNWPIGEIRFARGSEKGIRGILEQAEKTSIPVKASDKKELSRWAGSDSHQGIGALVESPAQVFLEELLEGAGQVGGPLLLLDGIEDPRNFGAIIRTALAAGAAGIVVPSDRSAPLSGTTIKVSSGAAFKMPIARVTNLARAIRTLKNRRWWVYGASTSSETSLFSVDWAENSAIVLGNEGRGLRPNIRKNCDILFHVPINRRVESLNVSVAAGVILFEMGRKSAEQAKKLP